jgi:uncharacterized membrane protein YbhN (UPF0104 family)
VLVLLVLAASAALPDELRAAAIGAGVAMVLGFVVLIAMANARTRVLAIFDGLAARVPLLGRWRLGEWLGHFLDGLTPLAQPRALGLALVWTAISWALSVSAGYVLLYAFYDTASWAAACLFIAAASFAVALPAVPGNIGTFEWAIVVGLRAFEPYAEPYSTAVAFAVTVHAVNLALYALFGVLGFIQEGVSLEQLSQGVRQMQSSNAG